MSSPTHWPTEAWPHPRLIPAKVRAVLNGIPGMVGYWDRGLRNFLANDEFVDYVGWAPEELFGTPMSDVLPEALYRRMLPSVRRALQGWEQVLVVTLVDVYGDQREVEVSWLPDLVDGDVQGLFMLGTDVTARVRAEEALQRSVDQYRALARSFPGGFVLLYDTDLRFLVADGAELSTFGYEREDLEGRTLSEAFPAWLAAELEPSYRAALAGESVTWERVRGRRTFKFTAGPVQPESGPIVSGLVTATDITAERTSQRTWAALHGIAADVARQVPPTQIADDIAVALVDIFGVRSAAVCRYDGMGAADVIAMAPVHPASVAHRVTFTPEDASAVARVQATGAAVLVDYRVDNAGEVARQLVESGVRIGAAAPIHVDDEVWGAIAIATEEADGIDQPMVDRLASFASLVELAVGNTSAWDSLVEEASTDGLTGLPNRRTFDEHLAREVDRAHRRGRDVAVAMMDLDHFKSVNDRHGHPAGDAVLVEFARRAREVSRDGELVARLGGEEFAWVMPETDGAAAGRAAERLRAAISKEPFPGVGSLTVSVGVCALSDRADGEELVSCADRALYDAKHSGRNQVTRYVAVGA